MARKRWRQVDGELVEVAPSPEVREELKHVEVSGGKMRRPGLGGRTARDFFAPEKLDRPMTRADYLNIRTSEEYSRREQLWYRQLWRFVRGWPRVKNMNAMMARSHGRAVDGITRTMQVNAEHEAARQKAGMQNG